MTIPERLSPERRREIEEYLALGHDKWEWRDFRFEVEAGWATTRELLNEIDYLQSELRKQTPCVCD